MRSAATARGLFRPTFPTKLIALRLSAYFVECSALLATTQERGSPEAEHCHRGWLRSRHAVVAVDIEQSQLNIRIGDLALGPSIVLDLHRAVDSPVAIVPRLVIKLIVLIEFGRAVD